MEHRDTGMRRGARAGRRERAGAHRSRGSHGSRLFWGSFAFQVWCRRRQGEHGFPQYLCLRASISHRSRVGFPR